MFPIAACHSWPNSKGRGGGGASPAGRLQYRGGLTGLWAGIRQDLGEALVADLARHPRFGGGSLRAFRRAEVIVDAVLFEGCVGGGAVAMTVASIFHFECWFLWGVFLMLFWMPFGSLLDPKGVP